MLFPKHYHFFGAEYKENEKNEKRKKKNNRKYKMIYTSYAAKNLFLALQKKIPIKFK